MSRTPVGGGLMRTVRSPTAVRHSLRASPPIGIHGARLLPPVFFFLLLSAASKLDNPFSL